MKFWLAAAVAASLTGTLLARSAALAGDDAVDCASTPFVFSGDGYLVNCQRFELPASRYGAGGQSQSDVINVTSDQPSVSLTLVSVRLISTELHMRQENLRENARDFFRIEPKDWNRVGSKDGYDTAEFISDISGESRFCVAVQRYLDPAHGGFMRHIIGLGCSTSGLKAVYTTLQKLQAPGD